MKKNVALGLVILGSGVFALPGWGDEVEKKSNPEETAKPAAAPQTQPVAGESSSTTKRTLEITSTPSKWNFKIEETKTAKQVTPASPPAAPKASTATIEDLSKLKEKGKNSLNFAGASLWGKAEKGQGGIHAKTLRELLDKQPDWEFNSKATIETVKAQVGLFADNPDAHDLGSHFDAAFDALAADHPHGFRVGTPGVRVYFDIGSDDPGEFDAFNNGKLSVNLQLAQFYQVLANFDNAYPHQARLVFATGIGAFTPTGSDDPATPAIEDGDGAPAVLADAGLYLEMKLKDNMYYATGFGVCTAFSTAERFTNFGSMSDTAIFFQIGSVTWTF